MAGALLGRKCLSFEAVSRVGPSTRPPSTSGSNNSAHEDGRTNALVIIVVVVTVLALIGLCMFVLVRRRNRLRHRRQSGRTDVPVAVIEEQTSKIQGLEGDEVCSEGAGRWSAQSVELVVMAGEDKPTFLAHPAPSATIIECHPLQVL